MAITISITKIIGGVLLAGLATSSSLIIKQLVTTTKNDATPIDAPPSPPDLCPSEINSEEKEGEYKECCLSLL